MVVCVSKTLAVFCLVGAVSISSSVRAQSVSTDNGADSAEALTMTQQASRLVESMAIAMNTLNYEGTFVHAQGATLTTMHILHASNKNGEFERLKALDGEAREVIRNNSLVTCIWPSSESVVVSKSKQRDLLPQVDIGLANNERYVFSLGMPDRVAGRATHVVTVTPRDEFRYGYRFWIDTQTDMLLRSMLLEGPDRPVEQVVFTDISYPDTIDESLFDIMKGHERSEIVSWLEPKEVEATSTLTAVSPSEQANRISFITLPDGYHKTSETYSSMENSDGPVSHVMLTDGMASVSVYVEHVAAYDRSAISLGPSKMGAMNAFGVSTEQAVITVVGEVPEATVRSIAESVIIDE